MAVIVIIGVVIARPWEPAAVTGSATGTTAGTSPVIVTTTPVPTTSESVVVAPVEPCDFADEFTGQQVDPSWEQLQNPQLSISNGEVRIRAPDGADIFEDQQGAPMLLRVPTGDFTIETQVDADPGQLYQGAGLVLWNGVDQYVRLERGFGNTGAIAFEYRDGGPHTKVHAPVTEDPNLVQTDITRVALQLTKSADAVSARWRPSDEQQWQELGQIAIALPASTQAGIAVLNRAQSGTVPEEFSAGFDYVHTSCD
jgi:beta-xylosidase